MPASERHLATTVMEAIKQRDLQRSEGASDYELQRNLEKTLRAAWPKSRPWVFLCEDCGDTGLVMFTCGGLGECHRQKPHPAHTYGVPCQCAAGARFQTVSHQHADVADAGRVRKKPTRWGR